jgi:hypothetical protein
MTMPSKEYFRNLAQMSRRIAGNMTDPAIAARLEAIGEDFDLQAAGAPNADPSDGLTLLKDRGQGNNKRT